MRQYRRWLGIIVFLASCVLPGTTVAQTTTTDAAIAELRHVIADQGAALDRQARIIEEQGRTLSALQRQFEAANPRAQDRTGPESQAATAATAPETQGPPSQPAARTAAERAPDLPAAVVSGDFPGSIRIPGTESAFKLGGQARMVAVHTMKALGTDDRFVTSSIPVGVPRAGEDARTVYSPAASRLSTELRTPSARDRCAPSSKATSMEPTGRCGCDTRSSRRTTSSSGRPGHLLGSGGGTDRD